MATWNPPTLADVLVDAKAKRDQRQAAKVVRRAQKLISGLPVQRDLASGRPVDDDFVDELDVDPAALVVCSGFRDVGHKHSERGFTLGKCGRVVAASMMRDVSQLPTSIVGTASYLCDGCWTTLLREGLTDLLAYAQAHGAPPAAVTAMRAHLLAHPDALGHPLAMLRQMATQGKLESGKVARLDNLEARAAKNGP